ncbi:uncharacterized protein HMPREF1120_06365 [Exophiala dermatitidis NIH/UT8656]|uniref:Uncharacterized protein n=1 Tax=Exophiala dermatitidis (strain ATCC 34100 / CBS 525.76 / NIH/UT8656) TaxID=858893 RepID=H6C3Y8_EXODN|nr:uncharacterized protein HMPREF1120_06365 [Exophiala dermatitidis NIH/UT8656]EHY58353.1 hypothetical protein HMPREF1120_06365 [Exophiala dermatitidis NIH/UT8656]
MTVGKRARHWQSSLSRHVWRANDVLLEGCHQPLRAHQLLVPRLIGTKRRFGSRGSSHIIGGLGPDIRPPRKARITAPSLRRLFSTTHELQGSMPQPNAKPADTARNSMFRNRNLKNLIWQQDTGVSRQGGQLNRKNVYSHPQIDVFCSKSFLPTSP